jgi:hypothetical protein
MADACAMTAAWPALTSPTGKSLALRFRPLVAFRCASVTKSRAGKIEFREAIQGDLGGPVLRQKYLLLVFRNI